MKLTRTIKTTVSLTAAALMVCATAMADLQEGQQATLFDSIDENLEPVSMEDLIDGKPLVMMVSSCT